MRIARFYVLLVDVASSLRTWGFFVFPSWIKFVNPLENLESTGKSSIFRLKICIFRLQIRIFKLQICIFSLKIEIYSDVFTFWKGEKEERARICAEICLPLSCFSRR